MLPVNIEAAVVGMSQEVENFRLESISDPTDKNRDSYKKAVMTAAALCLLNEDLKDKFFSLEFAWIKEELAAEILSVMLEAMLR